MKKIKLEDILLGMFILGLISFLFAAAFAIFSLGVNTWAMTLRGGGL